MLRILLIPVFLFAMLLIAIFCTGEGDATRPDFAFVNRGVNMTLDLNDMSYGQDIRIANALWEGIYRLVPNASQPVLGAADQVTVSPDQKIYTIHIRTDAKWSNGAPVLADDFLFEWRRMLETPKEYTYLHYYIKGAKSYADAYATYAAANLQHKPAKPDFSTVGEKRIDDHTIEVTLVNPVPYFPSILAFVPFYPMYEPSMRNFEQTNPITGTVTYRPEFTRPPNLVTNGPYRLAEWSFKQRLRMVANDYYWNRASVKSRVIDQITAEDPLAAYRLYMQGDVDWIMDVDGDIAAALRDQSHPPELKIFTGFGTYFYELNCQDKLPDGSPNPLRDPRVRQSLAMSIDKNPIAHDVAKLPDPSDTYVPPGAFADYTSPAGLKLNLDAARRLLADAGYPGGKGFPRIAILYNTVGIHGDIATIIRRQWATALGIDVDPHGEEASQYRADLHNHKFAIAEATWGGDYNDPSTFSDTYLSSSENNSAAWMDNRYDQLCAQAAVEFDHTKRYQLLEQAEDRLLTQAPIIPLFTLKTAYLVRSNLKGVEINAQQILMFDRMYKQPGIDR